jgi:hypothetical protein
MQMLSAEIPLSPYWNFDTHGWVFFCPPIRKHLMRPNEEGPNDAANCQQKKT